ncbi:MAG: alkaline phosphatase D family protein [Gemmatimonadota bacterium]
MNLVLHPRAAPSNCLRVWVGAFGRIEAPGLTWTLDGEPAVPTTLQPLRSVRDESLVDPRVPRGFTGIYEFQGSIQPGRSYRVGVRARDAGTDTLTVRALPEQIPGAFDAPFNVLLVSCFHSTEDRGGLAGELVAQMGGDMRPHLTLLLGDQVYLDLPTLKRYPGNAEHLAEKFEEDYRTNWAGDKGYSRILRAAPVAATPDDHEYWNNFPHPAVAIPATYTAGGREAWRRAACAMYQGFQLARPEGLERAVELDVHPLSIFMLDSRTYRTEDRSRSVHPTVLNQFREWTRRVADQGLTGAVVTGQSLFDEPAGWLKARLADRTLANYGDYGDVVRQLEWLGDQGRPVLCITGDVHWGRMMETRDRRQKAKFYEVISSPTSLVTTIGADQLKAWGSAARGLLGRSPEPWVRHADPHDPPLFLAHDVLGKRFACDTPAIHSQKGNHVTLLSFNQTGLGLELRVSYWPIFPRGRPAAPTHVRAVRLSPAY